MSTKFEVVVEYGQHQHTFPVEGWEVKGSSLVPVYDDGMTPSREHPQAEVRLREVLPT